MALVNFRCFTCCDRVFDYDREPPLPRNVESDIAYKVLCDVCRGYYRTGCHSNKTMFRWYSSLGNRIIREATMYQFG